MSKSIVKACVRYNDRLYTGFDHGECFKKLNEDNTILVHSEIEQGFVDDDGNFVDRKQAMLIAKEAGQLRYEPSKKTLISEDLHLDWLNQQDQRISELEEQLKNAIVPKFKIYQDVWFIDNFDIEHNCSRIGCGSGSKNIEKRIRKAFITSISIMGSGRKSDLYHLQSRELTELEEDGTHCFSFEMGRYSNEIFATKEEAEAKLRELQGEKK